MPHFQPASIADAIVHSIREPLLILDSALRVQLANRSFYRVFEVSPEETLGSLIYDLGNGQWAIPVLQDLLEDILPKQGEFNDFKVTHDFGAIGSRVMLLNARCVLRDGEASESILLAFEDITERVRIEEERSELETRFTSLVKNVRDHAIFTLDVIGGITSWNTEAERILGYSEGESLGKDFSIIFTPEDIDAGIPARELEGALREGRAEDERWHVRKNGELFWALGIVSPTHDAAGKHLGFSKILRDMTDRKRLEERLIETSERLNTALAAGGMGTWLWRVGSDEQILDESLVNLMSLPAGRPIQSLEGFLEAIHSEDRSRVRQVFAAALRSGEEINVEFRVLRPDGAVRWLKDRGKVFVADDGRASFLAGSCADITERKELEAALYDADRRKDEYLAILAHELRNPLAPIRTSIEIMRSGAGRDGAGSAVLAMMDEQLDHVVRLVDDLLDVGRIRQGKIELRVEQLEVGQVVNAAVEASRPWYDGVQLSVSLPSRPIYLNADRTRLAQIIGNLLHNASKFTKPGGQVWLSAEQDGSEAVIRVRDSGVGLAPDQLSRVFEMFAQVENPVDRSRIGLGLGLTLVKSLVELHGGTVGAQSEGLGKGSELIVRLPAQTEPVGHMPTAAAKVGDGALRGRRILVVDDNRSAADALTMFHKLAGADAQARYDGLEAIAAAEEFRPEVIIMDIDMPRMNGHEACRHIRQQAWGNGIVLVALTGWGQQDERDRTQESGFDAHLVKPVKATDLDKLLDSLLAERIA